MKPLNFKMFKSFLTITLFMLFTPNLNAQTVKTVGASGANYTTLKAAFDAINSGAVTGTISLQVIDNTTETTTASLNASGTGSTNYNSITIFPTVSGKSISGSISGALIYLNGADNITIDGRLNQSGNSVDLLLSNAQTAASAMVVSFANSAENNILNYCLIKGSGVSAGAGIISFQGSTSGNGNDHNLIDHNTITCESSGRPVNVIYSFGSGGRENSANTISNNNIFNFLHPSYYGKAISIAGNSIDFTISGNSIYETTTVVPTATNNYSLINISTSTRHLISGNYIGGSAPSCGGSPFTVDANLAHSLYGIYVKGGATTPVTVENNVIQNMNYTSTNTNPWDGIYLASGNTNVTGNTIGASSGTGSIVVTAPSSTGYSTSHGIRDMSTGTVSISSNNIGSITTIGTNSHSHCLEAIVISGNASSISITNNLIGSLVTAKSLQSSSAAASSSTKQDLRGIFINSNILSSTISGNTIANLYNAYSGNFFSRTDGIASSGGGIYSNNIIDNISAEGATVIMKGIVQFSVTGSTQQITGNSISNISNLSTANVSILLEGINFSGQPSANNVISGNLISNLLVASAHTGSQIYGIGLYVYGVTCANNIVNLGASVTNGYVIYGIYDNTSGVVANNSSIYFNSVRISGNVSSGTTSSTAALWNTNNGSTRNYRNNILMNARSGGTTGKHYAIKIPGLSGLTIDFNNYFAPSGVLGSFSGVDKSTLANWQTATTQDANSLNLDPLFSSDFIITATLPGVQISAISTDFAGIARGVVPSMGARENNTFIWQGTTSSDFNTASNWTNGTVPLAGANIEFAANPANSCVMDQNRIIGNLTNAQATDLLDLNGFQLTINGDFFLSNGAQINASANGSTLIMNGTTPQIFPNGAFVSNTVDKLDINNSNGLTLGGDLTIESSIALNAGNFTIGANTLTFNGVVNAMTGTVTGGASTNMIIGGNGTVISMPPFTLNNLTINRPNGVTMYGNLDLMGTLALTSGTLTVGAHTLSIHGNSPTRASGNVNASDANSTLVFANSSAIVLPASIFTGNVNNMNITGIGGVTASSDFAINGILNLNNGSLTAPNASSTKGLLDMGAFVLTMGSAAVNLGAGDVSGAITRNNPVANTIYSFGNPVTTFTLTGSGTAPAYITIIATIGSSATQEIPLPVPAPILRNYEILLPITSPGLLSVFQMHYLDSELNGNTPANLVSGDYDIPTPVGSGGSGLGSTDHDEHGIASYDHTTIGAKFVNGINIPIAYYMYIPGQTGGIGFPHDWRTIFSLYSHENTDYRTWKTNAMTSDWTIGANWEEGVSPTATSRYIIPDANTITGALPTFPSGNVTLQSISIGDGISLTALGDITVTATGVYGGGAWNDVSNGFIPNGHKVTFTGLGAGISGICQFYDVEIANDASIINMANNVMKIGNSITKSGTGSWTSDLNHAIIEYNKNGDQIVVMTDGTPHYHKLVISGSGAKALPNSAMTLHNDLYITGTATATANDALSIGGSLIIDENATFVTGNFNHTIYESITNNGTFTATTGNKMIMASNTAFQAIDGSATSTIFYNLEVNNDNAATGLSINTTVTVSNILSLTNKNIFTILEAPFTLASTASVNPDGGSAISFVDGPMVKQGTTAFTFPSGNGTKWARIGIGAPTSYTSFRASYTASADTNTSHMSTTVLPVLTHVSNNEHWNLDRLSGTGDATVTLYWEDAAWSGINDCSSLKIAHFNAADSSWENNNDASTTYGSCSGLASGYITTNSVVTSFSPFTFGSLSGSLNPLPIELIRFEAQVTEVTEVKLSWETASEINNDYFVTQRSIDGINWEDLNQIEGAGNSTTFLYYTDLDRNPYKGVVFYRLKQVDFDGVISYSEIQSVLINQIGTINEVLIVPNPCTNFCTVVLKNEQSINKIEVVDFTGKVVQCTSTIDNKQATFMIDFSTLVSGVYFIKIDGIAISQKVIKQ